MEEEKGEEGEEREEKEEAEEERSRNEINKGVKKNGIGWREEHEEHEIGTYHESENPAELEPERENAAESSEMQKRNSLCTGDVQVHR